MNSSLTRRQFAKMLLAGTAGLAVLPTGALASTREAFTFLFLGDLHFDKLDHHDLGWLEREKPNDVSQVRDYTRISREILPRLFSTLQQTVRDLNQSEETRVAFALQAGDLVEGLCGTQERAAQQARDAFEFVRQAKLGAPLLCAKGNHDITGPGAPEAYKGVFHPFLNEQLATLACETRLTAASRYAVEHKGALFCFFDAYDRDSLPWLEATLAKRTARHCFVILHPPVVPYGARSTWHLFSAEREQSQRERMLELLGKNHAIVLSGHIHKFNLLVRTTPGGGRFLQLAMCSVIHELRGNPLHVLSGVESYTPDQVKVEPSFSPTTEAQRRAVYQAEAPFIKHFEYADLPGYAVLGLNGAQVTATTYAGIGRQRWRTFELTKLLEA